MHPHGRPRTGSATPPEAARRPYREALQGLLSVPARFVASDPWGARKAVDLFLEVYRTSLKRLPPEDEKDLKTALRWLRELESASFEEFFSKLQQCKQRIEAKRRQARARTHARLDLELALYFRVLEALIENLDARGARGEGGDEEAALLERAREQWPHRQTPADRGK